MVNRESCEFKIELAFLSNEYRVSSASPRVHADHVGEKVLCYLLTENNLSHSIISRFVLGVGARVYSLRLTDQFQSGKRWHSATV